MPPAHRILVVDDNHDSAESLALLVEFLGNEVRMAGDGMAALEQVAAFRPGLAFLDIRLPGMSGYELARRIRALPDGEKVFLVAVTGWGEVEIGQQACEAGFDELVVKPMDLDVLKRILDEAPSRG